MPCNSLICNRNQKYMENCNKDMESFYPMYWDESNLYGWAMSQKWLMVLNGIKSSFKLNEKFIKNFDEDSDVGYILKALEYPKNLHNIDNDLPILPEKMKNKKRHKLTCNMHNKKSYVAHRRFLKQAMNNGLVLKKKYTE